jgi:serine/threonine protein kinase
MFPRRVLEGENAAATMGAVTVTRSIDERAAAADPLERRLPALVAGRYRVGERLGAGAFGVVYKATDERLQRPVALKVLGARALGHREALERFRTEALAASRLHDPGVVDVSDFDQLDDGVPFLVMEYVEGNTLAAVLAQGERLPLGRAVRLALRLCLTLDVAHAAGIIHRDLKPANLILRGAGTASEAVKIVDFGIAKLAEAPTGDDGREPLLGTPAYMAPEQVRGDPRTDGRADLYAVGVMLYEMVSGEIPFAGLHAVDLLVAKTVESPVPPSRHRPELPRRLEQVILRALARAPVERFATGAEMAAALAPFVDVRACGFRRTSWRWLAAAASMLGLLIWTGWCGRATPSSGAPLAAARTPGAEIRPRGWQGSYRPARPPRRARPLLGRYVRSGSGR